MFAFGSPFKYMQGPDLIDKTGDLVSRIAKNVFVVGDALVLSIYGERLKKSLVSADCKVNMLAFGGESTKKEINKLANECASKKCNIVIGFGGGKAIDTAKGVAAELDLPIVIIPSAASSDAPVSHIAITYHEDHSRDSTVFMRNSPYLVLVDSQIILKSPKKLLISGIGDAAATKFEADACRASGAKNIFGAKPLLVAQTISDLCWQTIYAKALSALEAMDKGQLTQDFEDVVEACTLLSGLGFESGGLAASHALASAWTAIKSTDNYMHGELVAFSTLIQLVLEKRPQEFLNNVVKFFKAVGLPTTLAQIGIRKEQASEVRAMAETACSPKNLIHNMPFKIDADLLEKAIYEADKIGG